MRVPVRSVGKPVVDNLYWVEHDHFHKENDPFYIERELTLKELTQPAKGWLSTLMIELTLNSSSHVRDYVVLIFDSFC